MTKIVFRIVCGDGDHTPQFDEQLRLISALTEEEAFEKATSIGLTSQDSFLNEKNQLVQWQFINIPELYKLASLEDGMEMYSRVQEADHASNFIDVVNKKADYIRSSISSGKVTELI